MNQEMSKLENVRKSCKTALTVIRILSILIMVAMVVCFVCAIAFFAAAPTIDAMMAQNPDVAAGFSSNFSVMGLNMTYRFDDLFNKGMYAYPIGVTTLIGGLTTLFVLIVFKFVGKILKSILETESPFSDVVLKRLKSSFILITVLIGVGNGLGVAAFLGMFLWCIYTIFQYGAQLQNQADETL